MNRLKKMEAVTKKQDAIGNRGQLLLWTVTIACAMCVVGCVGNGTNSAATGSPSSAPVPTPTTTPTPSTATTLPLWSNNFSLGGAEFPFTMIGTDPSISGAGTTNVPVEIIPISFNFGGVIVSPESSACGDTASATARVQDAPLFSSDVTWSDSGTVIGTTQFTDAFQRANFWEFVSTRSPNYHVMLQPVSMLPAVSVDVPPGIGAGLALNPVCPQNPLGGVPIDFMNSVAQNIIQTQQISAGTLPIFLTLDVQFLPNQFWGYHTTLAGNQTIVVASYLDPGLLGPEISDVLVLSHELAEWINNPLLINNVPPWGLPGQPCSTELEVGDPLAQSGFTVNAGGLTYHVQELAYFSWFARDVPSIAINGRYSTRGTFLGPAPPCP